LPPGADEALVSPPAVANTLRVALGDVPERQEAEPNDAVDRAERVELPVVVNGRIDRPGDIDRFAFTAAKGRVYRLAVTSAGLDLPLDPVLTVTDHAGKTMATVDDDGPSPDPKLDWTAPADGDYVVTVADRSHHGGEEYVYRLDMRPAEPDYRATVDAAAAAMKVEAGKSVDLKVAVARLGGHSAPLAAVVSGLPEGVTATTPGATAGTGPLTITLSAASGAAASSQPIRVLVVSADDRHPAARSATFDLGADALIRRSDALWLTVTRPPAATQPASQPATKPTTKPAGEGGKS
jgi:hypothetical protein